MKTSVPLFLFFFFFFFLFTVVWFDLPLCSADDAHEEFKACSLYYNCGDLVNVTYPFWGNERQEFCGRREFKLNCKHNKTTTIEISSIEFHVLNISRSKHTMTIARSDLRTDFCPKIETKTTTIDYRLFKYTLNDLNLSVWYDCPLIPGILDNYRFTCGSEGEIRGRANYAFETEALNRSRNMSECRLNIEVTITKEVFEETHKNRTMAVEQGVQRGFDVEYGDFYTVACEGCKVYGGKCGGNATHEFYCICGDGDIHPYVCKPPPPGENDVWKKYVIGFSCGFGGVTIMSVAFFIWFRLHKKKLARTYTPSSFLLRNNSSNLPAKELETGEDYMGVPLFSYEELEKATDRFNPAKELGDGGCGTVYYGKLPDGREVAVKRLFENNYRRVEHFMNEVEILTRLRHPHLVTLYGCTSRHCRELLLVYEFIPNGTVADHLHGERAKPGELPWHTRLKIAIETASALAFLHASETIHRDVKTTNILLDSNFGVKVADFGLSRLFPTQASHVSTAPQGTPGYLDPEYHECYQLTIKSDVFSFGVVLVELISSKPAVDITRHRHEINLWTMAINKIGGDELHEFVDPCLGFETDERVRDMICGVAELAFQCLQSVKDTRPTMSEALEILKNIESQHSGQGKTEEIKVSGEEDVVVKGELVPESPDSVVVPWMSKSSTPNCSG
ncbi:LEAF RUST 10 DISEASE-RESISTANCE LOCUS RECEPTOR-LIKE PROTEIN KINASE-like 1.2 [Cucurbita pepo subsp. pepo]|uniref:LEAF RUST 10 DISEASE-RESISTANCE LOCUS RECEPTOR-LIKE PROTEIN KINASE-like 1.2 n=1 Tax=Cucurbita pepo subsp. pepo TaxID=3664 RepID=UPI000C9D9D33|nr:LEAF RUST 10 DISEASE-RESISTANCE LOCUS RECEPTOR-LIKE PROTEIN KINASE-like 1.2 [Cucurbita pepo subsp. pepo]